MRLLLAFAPPAAVVGVVLGLLGENGRNRLVAMAGGVLILGSMPGLMVRTNPGLGWRRPPYRRPPLLPDVARRAPPHRWWYPTALPPELLVVQVLLAAESGGWLLGVGHLLFTPSLAVVVYLLMAIVGWPMAMTGLWAGFTIGERRGARETGVALACVGLIAGIGTLVLARWLSERFTVSLTPVIAVGAALVAGNAVIAACLLLSRPGAAPSRR
jgi:hypothetical protein